MLTYVDGLNTSSLWIRYSNNTDSGYTEQIESRRSHDSSWTKISRLETSSNDLYARQHYLGSTRAKRHQCQVGYCVIPYLSHQRHISSTTAEKLRYAYCTIFFRSTGHFPASGRATFIGQSKDVLGSLLSYALPQ